jgi:hypothetical protein
MAATPTPADPALDPVKRGQDVVKTAATEVEKRKAPGAPQNAGEVGKPWAETFK